MITGATLDELAKRIGRAIEASPAKDVEKNVKALLQGGLMALLAHRDRNALTVLRLQSIAQPPRALAGL